MENKEELKMVFMIVKIIVFGLIAAVVGWFVAYLIGMIVGGIGTDYSGAAAASYGLAKIGGGPISEGGRGMRGGRILITSIFGVVGIVASAAYYFVRFVRKIKRQRAGKAE